jgi:hypothetical protein
LVGRAALSVSSAAGANSHQTAARPSRYSSSVERSPLTHLTFGAIRFTLHAAGKAGVMR